MKEKNGSQSGAHAVNQSGVNTPALSTDFNIKTTKDTWNPGTFRVCKDVRSATYVLFDNLTLETANKVAQDLGKILNCEVVTMSGAVS